MALVLMLSWYKDASADKVAASIRASMEFVELRHREGVRAAACCIASFVDLEDFILAPGEEPTGEEEEPAKDAREGKQPVK